MSVRSILALLGGALIGLWFPDIDRVFPFLTHRSLLTHGLIVPLILFFAVRSDDSWRRFAVIGFCLAVAVHMVFDLYPSRWYGYALIYYPFLARSIGSTQSVVWLLIGVTISLYLALRLLKTSREAWCGAILTIGAFLYAVPREQAFWPPLLTLLALFCIASCLPYSIIPGRKWARVAMHTIRRSQNSTPTV